MRARTLQIRFLLFLCLSFSSRLLAVNPCPQISISQQLKPPLTPTEKNLICGDEKMDGWRKIPLNQAQFFLRAFLQTRGYNAPIFQVEGEKLQVDVGTLSRVTKISVRNDPIGIDASRFWEPINKALTPNAIDSIQKWVLRELSYHGYPCGHADMAADAKSGEVFVNVEAKDKWRIDKIEADHIPGARSDLPRRYDPFRLGEFYNGMLLDLSAQRLVADDVVVTSHFTPECEKGEENILRQTLLPGEPRLVTFGIGFDTEEYAIGQVSWKNSRFSTRGSLLQFSALTSYHRQEANSQLYWYYLPQLTRHHLKIEAKIERESERRYESRSITARAMPTWVLLAGDGDVTVGTGLSLRHLQTKRGFGPESTRLLSWDTEVNYVTYPFEYYALSPRAGHQIAFQSAIANTALGSDINANRWSTAFTKLWNLFEWDPPKWVLGIRGEYATTRLLDTDRSRLPPTFKQFLGGSGNIRGFGRKSLPPRDQGALTKAYVGTELRANHLLPYKLQPFIFVDAGGLGEKTQKIDPTLYWSPGLGLRWESPIGSLRSTIARGMIHGPEEKNLAYLARWEFYFSLGEQF